MALRVKHLLLLAALIGVSGWWFLTKKPTVTPLPSPTPAATTTGSLGLAENEEELTDLHTDKGDFRVVWEIIPKEAEIRVGINQELRKSSQQLYDQLSCRLISSAAFYDSSGLPLGLLVNEGEVISSWRENQLFNGIVGFGKKMEISSNYDENVWQWAVQAGPILWREGKPVALRLVSDQVARRVVAGVSSQEQLVLITLVAADSLYLGPMLVDLPQILGAWQNQTGIRLTDALNLDGGTASAFLSPTLKLRELKPIGSYICVEQNI